MLRWSEDWLYLRLDWWLGLLDVAKASWYYFGSLSYQFFEDWIRSLLYYLIGSFSLFLEEWILGSRLLWIFLWSLDSEFYRIMVWYYVLDMMVAVGVLNMLVISEDGFYLRLDVLIWRKGFL